MLAISTAVIRVSNSTINNNAIGVKIGNSGSVLSRRNNTVEGNTVNGVFTGVFSAK